MATKTQLRLTLTLAAIVAAATVVMPELALAGYYRPRGAPEVDPSTLSSAIALAMGGVAILRDKLRRR